MKISKVLLVRKKSTYEIQALEHQESKFLALIQNNHESIKKVIQAHDEHKASLNLITQVLENKGISYEIKDRSKISQKITDVDLVISVGGDGTLLDASHFIHDQIPILGVNSSTSSSFGHFCLAQGHNFKHYLEAIANDNIQPIAILRLELLINNISQNDLILNEVLLTHPNPAATSRYLISINADFEEQRSSGIIIATPAGSTGTLKAALGQVMPIYIDDFQYLVREPGLRPNEVFKYQKGILNKRSCVKIVSKMRQAKAFIDGPHLSFDFNLGDEVMVRPSSKFLFAFIDKNVNEQFK